MILLYAEQGLVFLSDLATGSVKFALKPWFEVYDLRILKCSNQA